MLVNSCKSEESPFDLSGWWWNLYQHGWEQNLYLNVLLGESISKGIQEIATVSLKIFYAIHSWDTDDSRKTKQDKLIKKQAWKLPYKW